MASPSELLSKWQEKQPFNQTVYRTKKIYFSGNSTRIVLQNKNGLCPLIAICNIMLLRGTYNLKDQTHVSEAQLLTFVAESLFKSLCKEENNVTTVADATDLMLNLTTGMLVDVKFQRIDDFVLTRENGVFGLLDMRLVHGWLVDPQDAVTANAIGSKSYITLMGEVVAHQINISMGSEAVPVKSSEEDNVEVEQTEKEDTDPASENSDSVIREPTSNVVESSNKMKETIAESCSSTTTNLDGVISELTLNVEESSIKVKEIAESSSLTTNGSDDVISEPTSNVVESSEKMKEPIAESSSSATVNSDSVISEPTSNVVESLKKMKEAIAESSSSASTSNVNEGELIKNFLKNNPTQLTVNGLCCLQEGLDEQKLCVFFRNNHFNTMFRYIGELYILVTDEGYMDQPGVVWEKLTEVTGDKVFVNSYFMDFKPVNHEIEEIPESSLKNVKKKDAETVLREFQDHMEGLEGSSNFNSSVQKALELLGIDENELLYGPEVEEIPKSEEKQSEEKRVKEKLDEQTAMKKFIDYLVKLIKSQGSTLSPNVKEVLKLLGLDIKDLIPGLREVENPGPKPEAGNPGPEPEKWKFPEPKLERDYSNSRRERMSSKKVKRIIKEKCYLM